MSSKDEICKACLERDKQPRLVINDRVAVAATLGLDVHLGR